MRTTRVFLLAVLLALGACAHFPVGPGDLSRVTRVGWSSRVLANLDSLWLWSQEERNELALCLYGGTNISGTAVYVRRSEVAAREEFVAWDAVAVTCYRDEDFLGLVHTHLTRYPDLSDTDRLLLRPDRFQLMAVIYGDHARKTWTAWRHDPVEAVGP